MLKKLRRGVAAGAYPDPGFPVIGGSRPGAAVFAVPAGGDEDDVGSSLGRACAQAAGVGGHGAVQAAVGGDRAEDGQTLVVEQHDGPRA
ncbi:hypothetical protein, partial [Streptomyces lushanensis]|uniref:hypothetical protein n=1 Tax=Streptomyces lushanensis TaxID=1434255 RepID=UPI001B806784